MRFAQEFKPALLAGRLLWKLVSSAFTSTSIANLLPFLLPFYSFFIYFCILLNRLERPIAPVGQTSRQRWQPTHFAPMMRGWRVSRSNSMAWCPPSVQEIWQRPQPMHFSRSIFGSTIVSLSSSEGRTNEGSCSPTMSSRVTVLPAASERSVR